MLETVLTPTSARATTMAAFPAGAGRLLTGRQWKLFCRLSRIASFVCEEKTRFSSASRRKNCGRDTPLVDELIDTAFHSRLVIDA